MKFASNKGGDDYGAHYKVHFKQDAAQWATEYSNAIYSMSQSEEEVKFKNVALKLFVTIILAGGCFVRDETLNEILSRKTVIHIKNNDNNCFWYSLVYSINNCPNRRNTINL